MSVIPRGSGGGTSKQEKTVTAGTTDIVVMPDKGKLLSKVTVNPTPTEDKTIVPASLEQIVLPTTGKHLSKVTVAGDSDLVAENIKYGSNIFGVNGSFGGVPVEYTYTGQSQITYDKVTDGGNSFFCFTLKLLSSGILNIKQMGTPYTDVYVIGGGGGGGYGVNSPHHGGGGGGGYGMGGGYNGDGGSGGSGIVIIRGRYN